MQIHLEGSTLSSREFIRNVDFTFQVVFSQAAGNAAELRRKIYVL